jgi:hypothetical protein
MAGRLSQVFRAVNQSLNVGGKHQVASVQKRHIGNLPVKPNPYVEDWATHRENVELTFKFDGKTIAILGAAAVTVPYVIYQMCCSEFQSMQAMDGRAQKKYWGRDAPPQPKNTN